jgi:IS30 family transposase
MDTFADRKTKFLLAKLMPDKSAASLNGAAVRAFKPVPDRMRNTLAVDNGKEFAASRSLSQALAPDICFVPRTIHGNGGLTGMPTG